MTVRRALVGGARIPTRTAKQLESTLGKTGSIEARIQIRKHGPGASGADVSDRSLRVSAKSSRQLAIWIASYNEGEAAAEIQLLKIPSQAGSVCPRLHQVQKLLLPGTTHSGSVNRFGRGQYECPSEAGGAFSAVPGSRVTR